MFKAARASMRRDIHFHDDGDSDGLPVVRCACGPELKTQQPPHCASAVRRRTASRCPSGSLPVPKIQAKLRPLNVHHVHSPCPPRRYSLSRPLAPCRSPLRSVLLPVHSARLFALPLSRLLLRRPLRSPPPPAAPPP
eukprot:1685728-Pleurochrysis_carterae.AAC.1